MKEPTPVEPSRGDHRHVATRDVAQDLSPERLRRFFVEEEGGYRISKSLREMVVFARQNVIADPPFSRMDVISCRKLLIYFDTGLQKEIFPVFHYALKPGGFLYLGASGFRKRLVTLMSTSEYRASSC